MVADTLARSLELRKQVTITFDSLLKFHYETRSRRCTQTQLATFQSNFSLRRANTFHRKNISIRVPSTGKRLCVFTEPGFQRACSVFAARPYFIEHYTIPTTEWLRSTGSHGDAPRSLFSRDTPPPLPPFAIYYVSILVTVSRLATFLVFRVLFMSIVKIGDQIIYIARD